MSVFKASFIHAVKFGEISFLKDRLICTNDKGVITRILDSIVDAAEYQVTYQRAKEQRELVEFGNETIVLPGFIDLHIHAPQWPQAGIALDEPLNVWLDQCTFPLEAKYADLQFAEKVYTDLVRQLLANGTTTAMYFATVDVKSSYLLAEICAKLGQRGLVGKVCMDKKDACPEYYRDRSVSEALMNTEQFIKDVHRLSDTCIQGVYPVITPRFIPSCSDEMLEGLGRLADRYDVHVQSHCSEGQWEHDTVIERYQKSDAAALHDFHLLKEKSIMAHCPFLSEDDLEIFRKTGASIAHCPTSNAYFANGVLPTKRFHDAGISIGLATDISGGYSLSMYESMRQAVISSRMLEAGVDVNIPFVQRGVKNSSISMSEAFYLATKGGAEALKLPTGSFEIGNACDFQVINMHAENHPLPDYGIFHEPEQLLHRILYLTNRENIEQVYVQGKLVHNCKHKL